MKVRPIIYVALVVAGASLGILATSLYYNSHSSHPVPISSNHTHHKNIKNTNSTADLNQTILRTTWRTIPSEDLKQQIVGGPKSGKVTKVHLAEGSTLVNAEGEWYQTEDRDAYMIEYIVDTMAIPNNRIVYVDYNTYEFIGYGLVD